MKPSQAHPSPNATTQNPVHLERAQLKTLEAIFRHPSAHNLEWSDTVALIEKIGDVEQKANNEFAFKVARERHLMHKPHSKDLSGTNVGALRSFLQSAGWSATGAAPARVADIPSTLPSLLVVVDHHGAKIYHIDINGDDLSTHEIKPYDPHHFLHHLTHKDQDREKGQRAPEDSSFYQRISQALAGSERILVVGHGSGHSNAAHHLIDYIRSHDSDTYARIVDEVTADLSSITLLQLLALARKTLRNE